MKKYIFKDTMDNIDLKKIKKHYGEDMMHLCSKLFPTILETKGLLYKILSNTFYPSKLIYKDIIKGHLEDEFEEIIASQTETNEKKDKVIVTTPPEVLLAEKGYDLYECKTMKDVLKFRKYYEPHEELCTFRTNRIKRCHIFFAIKKDLNKIKRSAKPDREDDYGRSVISIQFTRGKYNRLSIKNRYNHTVDNPDATYHNNLEEIAEGLTSSFEHKYNLNIGSNQKKEFIVPGYVQAKDGKYYKYNYEINNIYYCPNNVIIDNFEVKKFDKSKYLVLDYFILDLQNKKLTIYDDKLNDSFPDGIHNIKDITVEKDKTDKTSRVITINNDIVIKINNKNEITEYKNHHLTEINDSFLSANRKMKNLDTPNVRSIGNNFLRISNRLTTINLPLVEYIGNGFLSYATAIKKVNLPKVKEIGNNFMFYGRRVEEFSAPEVRKIGINFLHSNKNLETISLPSVEIIGHRFLFSNEILRKIELPKVRKIGDYFLAYNKVLEEFYASFLEEIEDNFMPSNEVISLLDMPKVKKIGHNFLDSSPMIVHFI